MSAYLLLQAFWRILPEPFRRTGALCEFKNRVAGRFPEHKQRIYTAMYYAKDVEKAATLAAPCIARSVRRDIGGKRVSDLGCGTGALLVQFAQMGYEVLGFEYSSAGCATTRSKGVPVHQFDVRYDSLQKNLAGFDVACCLEVAEHIPREFADRLVHTLVTLAPVIVFTAARPGQGGTDHVNEQPPEYWIEKFTAAGQTFAPSLTSVWSAEWRAAGAANWYCENLLVFSVHNAFAPCPDPVSKRIQT